MWWAWQGVERADINDTEEVNLGACVTHTRDEHSKTVSLLLLRTQKKQSVCITFMAHTGCVKTDAKKAGNEISRRKIEGKISEKKIFSKNSTETSKFLKKLFLKFFFRKFFGRIFFVLLLDGKLFFKSFRNLSHHQSYFCACLYTYTRT